jgi:uncharacterized protein (DUF1499 family)
MQITDRSKDVIKSGGEWISSIDLENLAVGHPDVAEAAVIGVAHPEVGRAAAADRRAKKPGKDRPSTRFQFLAFMEGKIAKWWMPGRRGLRGGDPAHRHRQDPEVTALAAFVVIWNDGLRGLGRAIAAFLIGVAVLAWPLFEIARSSTLPVISDITTDPSDPPRFLAVASARPSGANPVAYPGEETAVRQREAYPAVRPLELEGNPDEVFNIALAIVERHGWRVLDSVTPRGGQREGRIEAVALTWLMGFREDISIRIRFVDGLVKVDMRSASRYGSHDFGANARRIETFFADFVEARRRR